MTITSRAAGASLLILIAAGGAGAQSPGDAGRVGSAFGGSRQIVIDGSRPTFSPQAPRPQGAANRFSPQVPASGPSPRFSPQAPPTVSPQAPPRVLASPQAPSGERFRRDVPSSSPGVPIETAPSAAERPVSSGERFASRPLGFAPQPREPEPPSFAPLVVVAPEPPLVEPAEVEPQAPRAIAVEPTPFAGPRARIIGTYRDGDGRLQFLREGDGVNLAAATALWGVRARDGLYRPAPAPHVHGGGHHRPAYRYAPGYGR